MLFFRLLADGIDVIRVLHQSMDFDQHLWERMRRDNAKPTHRVGTGVAPR